jgi:hypothetical protein
MADVVRSCRESHQPDCVLVQHCQQSFSLFRSGEHTSQQRMQRPPVTVTVFGVLNIAFALFAVFGLFMTIALFSAAGATANPVVRIMRENPAYAGWLKITIPIGVIACAVLLACGIGLLTMKRWARKLTIGYAIYAIIFGLVGMVVNFMFLLRPLMQEAARQQGPEAAAAIGGAIGGAFGGCFGMIYPILLLIFMTRPKIVAAFNSSGIPPSLPPQA